MGEGFGERGARGAAGHLRIYRLPAHFFSLFFEVFFGGVSSGFLQSLWLQGGSIGGSLLEIFLKILRCSRKRWYPRF